MSNFKQNLDSAILKEKLTGLLEKLDRNNTSKMIIERHFASLTSLEIAEGKVTPKDAYDELKGIGVEQNRARHLATVSSITEKRTTVADSYLIQRIAILESTIKDLNVYSWMKPVENFINETKDFLKRYETNILIERVIFDLEMDKNAGYYKKAITKLAEASESDNPIFFISENLTEEKWIPLVKRLVEHCDNLKGSTNGHNPNFKVNRIYSPVEFIEESEVYAFHVNGKNFETDGTTITETEKPVSESFKKLTKITESAKFANKMMRLYPNHNSVIDIEFTNESAKVLINNKPVDAAVVESHLIAGGYLKYGEQEKAAQISHAISEGRNIKELDFAYRVTSNLFEGLVVNVFNINENVYIQKINPAMKVNEFILAESAEEAVNIVKDFMNYDISGSINHLLETEEAEKTVRAKEIAKIEGRIKFLIESRENLERIAKLNGVENTTKIKSAIELLESQIVEQNGKLAKLDVTKSEELNEGALEIAGGIVLGIVGLKTIGFLAKTIFGTLKLKAMKDPAKLKELAKQMAGQAMAKDPLKAALWNSAVNSMIDKGDIKDGFGLLKTAAKMDSIDVKKVFESEGFDMTEEVNENEVNESCVPGKEYKIGGEAGWVYQGVADGLHIFNNEKGGLEPKNYTDEEFAAAHKTGEITECAM
jgi:hypothetical protein